MQKILFHLFFILFVKYTKYISLVGHQNSVTTVVGYQQTPFDDIYVASGSADSTVKIWCITDTSGMLAYKDMIIILFKEFFVLLANCIHTVDFKNGFAITLELVPLDNHKNGSVLFIELFLNQKNKYLFDFSVFIICCNG